VWDKTLYIREAQRQFSDASSYLPLASPALPEHQKLITSTIGKIIKDKSLPPSAKLLFQPFPRQSVFYLLPKIHKLNNPGRPIVSACSSPTERISEYLDFILQPIVQSLPSYNKDTNHALNLLDKVNTSPTFYPCLLFTLDVVALYTSIPHTDGLRAPTFFLDRRPSNLVTLPPLLWSIWLNWFSP